MQEESSKEVILLTLGRKQKILQQKQENAHKQLYDSQLSKYYQQTASNQLETTPRTSREVPQSIQIQNEQNNQKSSISNPIKISFKELIKQKLIGSDFNSNFANLKKEQLAHQNQQNSNQKQKQENQQQTIPNINEIFNSSQVFNTSQVFSIGDQTNRNSSPGKNSSPNKSSKTPQSNKQKNNSYGQAISFSQLSQNNSAQPLSNKSLLETIKKSNFKDFQKEQFQNELQRLAIIQPQDCVWLQNEIEKVNQEVIPKEMLLPPEPYWMEGKVNEATPQVRKLYQELKRNYFKKYEGRSKKTFYDFAQLRYYIRHRGIVQLIEQELAHKKQQERAQQTSSLSRIASVSPSRQGQTKEDQSENEKRVNNIIKNKILKGNNKKFNQFRSQSIDLAFQFSKTGFENEQFENLKSDEYKIQITNDSTERSSSIQSPARKGLKRKSINSDFNTNQKNHVTFQEDSTQKQKKREDEFNQINSLPEFDTRSNKRFSFTTQTQNSIPDNNSPFSSLIFDAIENQQSSRSELQNLKVTNKVRTVFAQNASLPNSPLKQRSINNSQNQETNNTISPFNSNLKKKYYVLKQRNTSPRKWQKQIKANSLSQIQVQQIKQEQLGLVSSNFNNLNSSQKNLNNSQQTQTEQLPIRLITNSEQDFPTEQLKKPIRSKSQVQYSQSPSTTSRSLRFTKYVNRSQSPSTNRSVKFLNFSEICSKIENTQNQENNQQKAQTERNSQSLNNINQFNIKSNVLRQSAKQYLNMNNNDLSKYTLNQRNVNENSNNNNNNLMQTSQIFRQSYQNNIQSTKNRLKEPSQKTLIIQQDTPSSQSQLQTEGNQEEQQQSNDKNQHFSITNKFFDRLEKKRNSNSKSNKKAQESTSQNNNSRSGYCNLNYHNNNTILSSSSAAVAKLVLQKRLISNFGNSQLLNNLDVNKLKKAAF